MRNELLKTIADNYSTPAYVFDEEALLKRVEMIKEHLGKRIRICYAMKANPFLVQSLSGIVNCYEACSPGEFRICERNAIPMEKIVLSGVYKEKKDILYSMQTYNNEGVYTIESIEQLHLIEACAAEVNIKVYALIRVTSGNQFGLDKEDVCRIIGDRDRFPHIHFKGLQQYTGTQKKNFCKIKEEITELDKLITHLKENFEFEVSELEYGPGFYVPYFQTDAEVDDVALLDEFAALVKEIHYQGSITLELGRYIAAYCGYYITKIVDQKKNCNQNYSIIDGGIHHLSYFGQAMAMKLPYYQYIEASDAKKELEMHTICGALCTVNDVIIKNLPLFNAKIGDILVFKRVGAYSVTEGIYLFLSRDLPEVLLWSKEHEIQVLRERISSDILCDGSTNWDVEN